MCPGCGHPTAKAWDPDTEDNWQVPERTCYACAAIAQEQAQQKAAPPGVRYVAVLDEESYRRDKEARERRANR